MQATVNLNITANFAGLEWTLKEVAERTKLNLSSAVLTAARTVCNAFGPGEGQAATWPKTQFSGQVATGSQVRRAYHTAGSMANMIKDENKGLGKAFWKAYKDGDAWETARIMAASKSARGIRVIDWDAGMEHRRLRKQNSRGRILKGHKPKVMVTNLKRLQQYTHYQQKKVGFTQRGFYVCLRKLVNAKGRGGKNYVEKSVPKGEKRQGYAPWPQWIVKVKGKPEQHIDNGNAGMSGTEWAPSAFIHNKTPWASNVMGPNAISFIAQLGQNHMRQYMIKRLSETKGLRQYARTA